MNALAVIQTNFTDLLPNDTDPSHYCITALKKSKTVERIVLAAPDTPSNTVFRGIAEQWGVARFLGPEYDIVKRLIGAADMVEAVDSSPIARVLLNRFYLDVELVDQMINLEQSTGSDYVTLPYDFDINFGADVFTLNCLRRVDQLLTESDIPTVAHLRFRPWLFIEDHSEAFRVVTYEDVPSYPPELLQNIRASGLFSDRDIGTYSAFTYTFVQSFLQANDVVLDIACGTGDGAALLAQVVSKVHAADLDVKTIRDAREKHKYSNLVFDIQDGCALTYPDGYFNVVVCSNTLEHVADDRLMLENLYRILRPGGLLILETPLLRGRPFNFPIISSHLREYNKEALLNLICSCGFSSEHQFGMNRGQYVGWDRAREAVLVVARRI